MQGLFAFIAVLGLFFSSQESVMAQSGALPNLVAKNQTPSLPKELEEIGQQTITVSMKGADGAIEQKTMTLMAFHGLPEGEQINLADTMSEENFVKYEKFRKDFNNFQLKNIQVTNQNIVALNQEDLGLTQRGKEVNEQKLALNQSVEVKKKDIARDEGEVLALNQEVIKLYTDFITNAEK